ncbi:hypothetical protein MAPG_05626 [Magnaporthiopsis poae ATCC 64411]|uniref:Seipin n=1 Tax=Magnaporthiopsis poae (strain ATCC 64411 / 73-15) TaxID=644358 RepID=A0A0C4DZW5_MAGP6|nr:hypothetical protein MAPG_05626 [Magnaporthiopsis poae ATCC 64411]
MDSYLKSGFRAVTSKTAQRTVLKTIVLVTTSLVLLGLSAFAYLLFYQNYLPDQVSTIPLHLQYGRSENPYAIVSLPNRLVKESQDYDVTVSLTLPRSPANLERGNFMVSMYLSTGSVPSPGAGSLAHQIDPRSLRDPNRCVYSESRPALMPYTDPVVSVASRILLLGWNMLFPLPRSATAVLAVPLAEKVSFAVGSQRPRSLLVELETGAEPPLRTYSASVTFTAQLSGLRWLMYRHWLLSFVVFTVAFWACSMLSTVVAWGILAICLGAGQPPKGKTEAVVIKNEPRQDGKGVLAAGPDAGGADREIKKEEDYDDDMGIALPPTPRTHLSSTGVSGKGPPPSYQSGGSIKGRPAGTLVKSPSGGHLSSPREARGSPGAAEGWDEGDNERNERWKREYSTASTGYDEGREVGSSSSSLRRRSSQRSLPGS